ncbi:MAG: tetratricopeptide repeat protein [Cryomorphaceae bacterium]|nr:tetratricopeptide repeat protein [Cryomorphaceae bacterium]
MRRKHLQLTLMMMFTAIAGMSQKTATFSAPDAIYREALDLFDKEKFAAAQSKFEITLERQTDKNTELSINAEYYSALCALYLYHKDAEYRLENFVGHHPESPWVKKVYYELAAYNYLRKRYSKALEWFAFTNPKDLNGAARTEYYFKRGHSYFEQGQLAEARQDFAEVKDDEGEFGKPALYYYSHILYTENQYQTAMDGFRKLENDPNFKPVVPYYISQILYKQGRYNEMLAYAPALMDSANTTGVKRLPEIARLIGDAYYRESKYTEALPYLERYHAETPKAERSREDFFQLGYCYYQTGDYEAALENLSEASKEDDLLAQSATYHMADCYLKLDKKNYARTAFKEASELEHSIEIKEDALFNYAKLSFELSFNPFHEAITAFETYLETYPNSARHDEAYEFLLSVYMKTKAYDKALVSLDKIQNKDTRTKEAYQFVAFNRGVELFQAGRDEEAMTYFDKVATYPVNAALNAEALFWKAELAYRLKDNPRAVSLYNAFLQEPGGYQSSFYNDANYGIGYALFHDKKYSSAAASFRKYLTAFSGADYKKKNDALLRTADCYYVSKDYDQALNYYNQAIALDQPMKDYALYQKGLCYGLKGEEQKEIDILKKLIDEEVDSRYTVDAKFQLAKTYLSMDKRNDAMQWYENILREHPNSPYVKYSLVDLCLINVKTGNNARVLELWNRIKTDYPNDKVVIDAFNVVEDVLVEEGRLDELPSNLGLTSADIEEKVYAAAADFAITGDCTKAIPKLEEYLRKYSPAIFGVPANYYLGNCYFEQGKKDLALNCFNFVISQQVSDFTESSLVAAATINYNNKNYSQALNHYMELETVAILKSNVLEAQIGQMRCHYLMGEMGYAKEYADKVIANENTPDDIKLTAYLWRGKILKNDLDYDNAYKDFAEVNKKKGSRGAEAKYYMSEIAYLKKAYPAAETEIFQLIENYASFEEWKFKGFLLLSDVYIGLEDYFQARATLNTIIDNVSTQWVVDEAKARLQILNGIENRSLQQGKSEDLEIDLNNQ